ncbi:hypothetical protein [uncultured Roseobacter sp.]|nr:hypothetical protein [uncultured Roseobacter sp.]
MQDEKRPPTSIDTIVQKLKTDISLTAPGWVFAVAGIVVLVLIGAALD